MPRTYTRWNHESYVERLALVNPNLEVIGTFKNTRCKVTHKCRICGEISRKLPCNTLKGHQCRKCGRSKEVKARKSLNHFAVI